MLSEPGQDKPRLTMLSLGVVGDQRELPELQPPLAEGIHLRWAFEPSLGFPWYGFYLFRKPTTRPSGATVCVGAQFASLGLVPGLTGSTSLAVPLGSFNSDENLNLTDEFPTTGIVEIDLSRGTYLEFQGDASAPAGSIDVTIGFIDDYPQTSGSGGDGTGPSSGPGGLGSPGTTYSGTVTECSGGGTEITDSGLNNDTDTGLGGSTIINRRGGTDGTGGGPGGPGSDGIGATRSQSRSGATSCVCSCASAGKLRAVLERVIPLGDGTYSATFGYSNPGDEVITIPIGPDNSFYPGDSNRGQPTSFVPGCHTNAFTVTFDGTSIVWSLDGTTQTVSTRDFKWPTASDGILVSFYRTGVCVKTVVVRGRKGDVKVASCTFDTIDEVRISRGPARLVNLCWTPATASLGGDWVPVPNFPQPMSLPVFHQDYPCNPGTPDQQAAQNLALQRIRYGSTAQWQGDPFALLHESLLAIVDGGPSKSIGITDSIDNVTATPDSSSADLVPPTWQQQSTLRLLLTASVHPAIAQMLGLYWVDDTTVQGQLYDYMLVADYNNAGGGDVNAILTLLTAEDYSSIDVYPKSGAQRAVPMPLTPPTNVKGYALPLNSVPTELPGDVAGVIGLRWDIPLDSNKRLAPDGALLYHVWRHDFGATQPGGPAGTADHRKVTELPIAPGQNGIDQPPQISDWPEAGVFTTDGPLFEGWYGYRLNGIDIFGRYSALSDACQWLKCEDDSLVDSNAVELLDTTPPPAPASVLAWALDPKDPYVISDDAYNTWRGIPNNTNTVGLRVSWVWTSKEMRRAPDTREFRIYINPGLSVTPTDPDQPSQPWQPNWQARVAIVGVNEQLKDESFLPLRSDLTGSGATVSGNVITLGDVDSLDGTMTYGLEIQLPSAVGGQTHFFVQSIDSTNRQVTVDGNPVVSGPAQWTLGFRVRIYEVFLPGASLAVAPAFSWPNAPALATPTAYDVVGVSAADDKNNSKSQDQVTTGVLGNRYGNEGPIGGPASVYRVWRDKPNKTTLPVFPDERLWATRADFHSKSYFAFHFTSGTSLSVHVYRALDETLFLVDSAKGFAPNRRSSDANDLPVYPDYWTSQEKAAAIAELNALQSADDYKKLSNRALRVLASYASNAPAFACLTGTPIAESAGDARGPSDPADYQPQDGTGVYVDTLDGRATNRYFYRAAYVDKATNAGDLGISTPPVYLPESHLPRTVRITRVTGGEQSITVAWPDQTGVGIKSYRLFRTDNPKAVRNIRHMTEVLPASVAGTGTDGELQVTDYAVTALKDYYYRLVAVSEGGVESEASLAVSGRAMRTSPPMSPDLTDIKKLTEPTLAYELVWSAGDDISVLVQRHIVGASVWTNPTSWIPAGITNFVDDSVEDGVTYEYRLRGRDRSGTQTPVSNTWSTEGL